MIEGEVESSTAYNAGVIDVLQKELLGPVNIERFGKAPAWVRSVIVDLIRRIANLRAAVSERKPAHRVPTPAERDGIAVITYRWKGETRRWSIGCDLVEDNQETIRAHLARWIPGAEFVAVEFQQVRPTKLLAAAKLAFEALERRSKTRRKWTMLDQRAYEALQEALKDVEPGA